MAFDDPLYQLLYVSELAPARGPEVVKAISVVARQHNRQHGLSGALLFDGERFCQLIEGREADVRELMERIARDPRHTGVRLLVEGATAGPRLMPRWASGYCEPGELEPFDAAHGLAGAAALQAFAALLRSADLE